MNIKEELKIISAGLLQCEDVVLQLKWNYKLIFLSDTLALRTVFFP